jgi:hypothetical protein
MEASCSSKEQAFARADGEVVLTLDANLEIGVQFLVVNHVAALFALGPEALGDVAFARFGPGQLGLFQKSGLRLGRGRSDGRLRNFEPEGLLVKRRGCHVN